ncbi:hypothetical protein V8E51_008151 [Hyaloscypha variabilis]
MASRRDLPATTSFSSSRKALAPYKRPTQKKQLSDPNSPTKGSNDMLQDPAAASQDHSESGPQASMPKLPAFKKLTLQKPQSGGMSATPVASGSMQSSANARAVLQEQHPNVGFQANNTELSLPGPSLCNSPKAREIKRVSPAKMVAGQRRKTSADQFKEPLAKRTRGAASGKKPRFVGENDEAFVDTPSEEEGDEEYQESSPRASKPNSKKKQTTASKKTKKQTPASTKEKTMADLPSPDEIPSGVLEEMLEDFEEVLAPVPGAPADNPYNESEESIQAQIDALLKLEKAHRAQLPNNEHNGRLRRRLESILRGLVDKVKQNKISRYQVSVKFKKWFDFLNPTTVIDVILCAMPERARCVLGAETIRIEDLKEIQEPTEAQNKEWGVYIDLITLVLDIVSAFYIGSSYNARGIGERVKGHIRQVAKADGDINYESTHHYDFVRDRKGTCNFRYLAVFPNSNENVGLVLLTEILLIILCRAFVSADSHDGELEIASDLLPADVKFGEDAPVGLNRTLSLTCRQRKNDTHGGWGPPPRRGPCYLCQRTTTYDYWGGWPQIFVESPFWDPQVHSEDQSLCAGCKKTVTKRIKSGYQLDARGMIADDSANNYHFLFAGQECQHDGCSATASRTQFRGHGWNFYLAPWTETAVQWVCPEHSPEWDAKSSIRTCAGCGSPHFRFLNDGAPPPRRRIYCDRCHSKHDDHEAQKVEFLIPEGAECQWKGCTRIKGPLEKQAFSRVTVDSNNMRRDPGFSGGRVLMLCASHGARASKLYRKKPPQALDLKDD